MRILFFLIFLISFREVNSQPEERYSAADIHQAIKKLDVLGSVLYIAAHPDDENTRLITYFTREKLYHTAYLSLTRGDGGQNLIGSEMNELLGIIRTQELLEARKIDGGKQYFSRARDFGFSKNPDETFRIWNREEVLADMVWVIRQFRPDVMITRFNTDPGRTHGHHTASAILAVEAFEAASDPTRFSEQLKYVETWQAKRLLWNTNSWFYANQDDFKKEQMLLMDVGKYNPTLGSSYTEIAAQSRSMHKSQGFGAEGSRGSSIEYLEHLKGPRADRDIFEDIDANWSRIKGGVKTGALLRKAYEQFNPANPAASAGILLEARKEMMTLAPGYWRDIKLKELENVLKVCLGIWTEAVSTDFYAVPGQPIKVNTEVINRSSVPVELKSVKILPALKDTVMNISLSENIVYQNSTYITLPKDFPYTQPYWLKEKGTTGMFVTRDQQLIHLPENLPPVEAVFSLSIQGDEIAYSVPLVYKETDPVKGEMYRPFEVTPPAFISTGEQLMMFADKKPKEVSIKIRNATMNFSGTLHASLPAGWKAEPASIPVSLKGKDQEELFKFKIFPSDNSMTGELNFFVVSEKDTLRHGINTIKHDHIPTQTLFPEASVKVVRLDLKKKGEKIGYIMGAGDEVASSLSRIGYKVSILKEEAVTEEMLKQYDAVVIGIRAFNTTAKLKDIHPILLRYVKNGGRLVVQYNTLPPRFLSGKFITDSIGPYPFRLSSERVTMEDAPVRFINPAHPLLNVPNKITEKDFEGWVQERGLYFPNEWSDKYQTVISTNDEGENPKDGGILYARYGKGVFIYTSYSWFRQLPAGVPGAYRVFVNMISK